jgi:hypothetical protein
MTIGTGFFGRSSTAENLHPRHLVQWTRLAYSSDPAEAFGDFTGLVPWQATAGPKGPVPPYPVASNQREASPRTASSEPQPATAARSVKNGFDLGAPTLRDAALREEIRRLIIEELSQLVRE